MTDNKPENKPTPLQVLERLAGSQGWSLTLSWQPGGWQGSLTRRVQDADLSITTNARSPTQEGAALSLLRAWRSLQDMSRGAPAGAGFSPAFPPTASTTEEPASPLAEQLQQPLFPPDKTG